MLFYFSEWLWTWKKAWVEPQQHMDLTPAMFCSNQAPMHTTYIYNTSYSFAFSIRSNSSFFNRKKKKRKRLTLSICMDFVLKASCFYFAWREAKCLIALLSGLAWVRAVHISCVWGGENSCQLKVGGICNSAELLFLCPDSLGSGKLYCASPKGPWTVVQARSFSSFLEVQVSSCSNESVNKG